MSVALKALIVALLLLLLLGLLTLLTALVLPWQWALLFWGGLFAALIGWAALMPLPTDDLAPRPDPASNPEAARQKFAALIAGEGADIHDACRSRLIAGSGHERARRAVVIFHGLSSCPHAQVQLAPLIADAGCAVLVARMPFHGQADNKSDALRHYLGPAIVAHVDEVLDIAAGLGDELVVSGISGGAVLAGWAAQTRADVAQAFLIAPFYGMATFDRRFNMLLMRLLLLLPNFSIWKNPLKGSRSETPPHSMARQSSRGVAEMMRVGLATRRRAMAGPAAAAQVRFVLNEADIAISNAVAAGMAAAMAGSGTDVGTIWIPGHHQLPHELIDPVQIGDRTAVVNPALTELLAWSRVPAGLSVR